MTEVEDARTYCNQVSRDMANILNHFCGSDGKEFHSTMRMNSAVCVISTFSLKELSIISSVTKSKRAS